MHEQGTVQTDLRSQTDYRSRKFLAGASRVAEIRLFAAITNFHHLSSHRAQLLPPWIHSLPFPHSFPSLLARPRLDQGSRRSRNHQISSKFSLLSFLCSVQVLMSCYVDRLETSTLPSTHLLLETVSTLTERRLPRLPPIRRTHKAPAERC